jgi:hypothetical protein
MFDLSSSVMILKLSMSSYRAFVFQVVGSDRLQRNIEKSRLTSLRSGDDCRTTGDNYTAVHSQVPDPGGLHPADENGR